MSDILARLQAAHSGRRMVKVHVPEYEMDLFFSPLSMADHERSRRGVNPKDEHGLMVSALINLARDAKGEPAFPDSPEMRAELHKMELSVMHRIMAEWSAAPGAAAETELAELDADAIRKALLGLVEPDGALASALASAPEALLSHLLYRLVAEVEVRTPVKNA